MLCIEWRAKGDKYWNYLTGTRGLGMCELTRRVKAIKDSGLTQGLYFRITDFKY